MSDREIFRRLDLKFGTQGEVEVAEGTRSEPEREALYRSFVRQRMTQKAFYERTLAELQLIFPNPFKATDRPPLPFTLKKVSGSEDYYLDQPCKPRDRVKVHPWWDLEKTVSICADSYKPEVVSYKTGESATVWCTASKHRIIGGWDNSPCKCGRNLMNCAPSIEVQQAILDAFNDEQTLTVRHIVTNKLRFGDILTLPSTVRSDYADFFYARSQFIATNHWSYAKPTKGSEALRPRPPEFNAGILSTWIRMVQYDSYRVSSRNLWNDYLCSPLASRNVTAEEITAALKGSSSKNQGDLRDSVRMEFAAAPGCQNCHKILENASKAMTGFTLVQYGSHFMSSRAYEGTLQFYLGSLAAPRAEGPATLAWLGKTISEQPEFNSCVVSKVLKYLYDGYDYPPELKDQLEARFAVQQDFASMFESAVVARYLAVLPDAQAAAK